MTCPGVTRPSVRRPASRNDSGFTLIEIVVALVVLGVLLATLTRGVQFGLAAFDRQDRMIETGGRLESVDRLLRRVIRQLDPGTQVDGDTVVGTAHGLVFRAPLPIVGPGTGAPAPGAEPASGPADPSVDAGLADLRLSVDAGHRLVLAWLPHRHVVAVGPAPKPYLETLLNDVDRIDLSYFNAGQWHTHWQETSPPSLIRVRIVFPDGDPRHWPDIVAAPIRDQAG